MLNQNIVEFKQPYGIIARNFSCFICNFLLCNCSSLYLSGQSSARKFVKSKLLKVNNEQVTIKNMLLRQLLGVIVIEGVLYTASAIWHELVTIITQTNFVTPLMYAGFIISGISILLYLFKGEHRTLHDYLGNTKRNSAM